MKKLHQTTTHERYLHAVRDVVIARALERQTITGGQGKRLAHTKLLYGVGDGTDRGVTVFDAWENGVGRVDIVEIAATGQESWIQLAGTVIHELGHVLSGMSAGHSNPWKDRRARVQPPTGGRWAPVAAPPAEGLRLPDETVGVCLHAQAGQGPGHLRRLPSHLPPLPHRV